MSTLKVGKVLSSLPGTLVANMMYAVRVGVGYDLYITDSTGSIAYKQNAPDDVIVANVQSGTTYTNVAGDCGKEIQMTSATANTVYIDASVASAGKYLIVRQCGAGQTTIAFISGTTYQKSGATLKTAGKGSAFSIRFDSASLVYVNGECAAS